MRVAATYLFAAEADVPAGTVYAIALGVPAGTFLQLRQAFRIPVTPRRTFRGDTLSAA